jgi:hypothetical protein
MKRLDEGRVSLAEFLRSIKFTPRSESTRSEYRGARFAHFYPRFRTATQASSEELHLVRSAN